MLTSNFKKILGLTTAVMLVSGVCALADFGVDFQGRNAGATLTVDQVAGLVPQANWTVAPDNCCNNNGSVAVQDHDGAATAVTFTWWSADSWNNDGPSDTPDAIMMNGCIKANGGSPDDPFGFHGLPPNHPYRLILYASVNGSPVKVDFIAGGVTKYIMEEHQFSGAFTEGKNTINDDAKRDGGNFVQFDVSSDVNGDLLFTMHWPGNGNNYGGDGCGLSGVQLLDLAGPPRMVKAETGWVIGAHQQVRVYFNIPITDLPADPTTLNSIFVFNGGAPVLSASLDSTHTIVMLETSGIEVDPLFGNSLEVVAASGILDRLTGTQPVAGTTKNFLYRPAATVSVNFNGGWGGGIAETPIDPTDVAGPFPLPNWNTVAGQGGIAGSHTLMDTNGATTDINGNPITVTVGFAATGTWAGNETVQSADDKVLKGYMDLQGNNVDRSWFQPQHFMNVPDGYYKLVILTYEDGGGQPSGAVLNRDYANAYHYFNYGGEDFHNLKNTAPNPWDPNPTPWWVRGTSKDPNNRMFCDYIQFDDVVPVNGVITFEAASENFRSPVAGLQLIAVDPLPAIVENPVDTTVSEFETWRFSAAVEGPGLAIQWYSNNIAIPGANGTNFSGLGNVAGNGAKFHITISNLAAVVTSSDATLTVLANPKLETASNRGHQDMVFVTFSKPVDKTTGTITLTPATAVNSVDYGASQSELVLSTAALVPGTTFTVHVQNLSDLASHVIAPNPSTIDFLDASASAPSLCADFTTLPAGSTAYGNAQLLVTPDGNSLMELTANQNSQNGAFIVNDIASGASVNHWTTRFSLHLGEGSAPPADGMSFCWAADLPAGVVPGAAEEGGGTGLIVSFDQWDSGFGEAPAIDVFWGGNNATLNGVAHTKFAAPIVMQPGEFREVVISLHPDLVDGTKTVLDLDLGGVPIYHSLVIPAFTPLTGAQFGWFARTGGANENTWMDDLCINIYTEGDVNFTLQPADALVNSGDVAMFAALADGTPAIYYQWYRENTPLAGDFVAIPGETNNFLVAGVVGGCDDNRGYRVAAYNSFSAITSTVARVLLQNPDLNPPNLVSAASDNASFQRVIAVFDKALDQVSAETAGNYSLNNGVTVLAAKLQPNLKTVILTTSPQAENTAFSLTATGINDRNCPPDTGGGFADFQTLTVCVGLLKREEFDGINGTAIASLTSDPKYINNTPDLTDYLTTAAYSPELNKDNYGLRLSGFLVPNETGDYVFADLSDDASQVFVGTNSDPASLVMVVRQNGCCGWVYGNVTNHMVAGQRYAFMALQKEGGGGDYIEVSWKNMSKGFTSTGRGSFAAIPAHNFAAVGDPTGQSLDLVVDYNTGNLAINVGDPFTFTVTATATTTPISYQWQKLVSGTWVSIPFANLPTYTVPNATAGDAGSYRCYVAIPGVFGSTDTGVLAVGNAFGLAPCLGFVKAENYDGGDGSIWGAQNFIWNMFVGMPNFPAAPTDVQYLNSLYRPERNALNDHINDGTRIRGFIVPSETADYQFGAWSDDASELWLSTNEDVASLSIVAGDEACCQNNVVGATRHLVAGQLYAILVLQENGTGGDYVQIQWMNNASITSWQIVPGGNLAVAPDPTVSVSIDSASIGGSVDVGGSITFTVTVSSAATPIAYQWQKLVGGNFVNIPAANNATYSVFNATPEDAGTYQCYVSVPGSCGSASGDLTVVNPDNWVACFGFLKVDRFDGIPNTDVASLLNSAAYQANTPTFSTYVLGAGYSPNLDAYGVRMMGYVVPSETADYTFADYSDDSSVVYLSTDDNVANATKIVEQLGCCGVVSGATRHLIAGQKYALLAFYKEGGGGDYLYIYWKNNVSLTAGSINGSWYQLGPGNVASYANPVGASVSVVQQPAPVNATLGGLVHFQIASAASSIPVAYQWQANTGAGFVDISGANLDVLEFTAKLSDAGDYQCKVAVPGACTVSQTAHLNVVTDPDSGPPVAVSVNTTMNGGAINVCFSEVVVAPSATTAANYSINGGAAGDNIASVVLQANATSVKINLVNPIAGAFTVHALGVLDNAGMASDTTIPGTVSALQDADFGIVGDPSPVGTAFSCADGSYEVRVGGSDIWGTEDHGHFVYVSRTGDFDIKARVDRLDPTSPWAKAGVMARTTLDEHAGMVANYADAWEINLVNQGNSGANAVECTYRFPDGGNNTDMRSAFPASADYHWLRLTRVGGVFTASYSADGLNWLVNGVTPDATGIVPDTLLVGLMTTSHNNGTATVADFSNIFLSPQVNLPVLSISWNGTTATVTWSGGRLESTANLNVPFGDTGLAGPTATFTSPTGNLFFRVVNP